MKSGEAFHQEMQAASTWLLAARPVKSAASDATERISRWGWVQDVRPSALNTAEALVALDDVGTLDESVFADACAFMIEDIPNAELTVRHAGWIALALRRFCRECPAPGMQVDIDSAQAELLHWLGDRQNTDGGWGSRKDEASMVPTTALVLRALDPVDDRVAGALDWLRDGQNKDGGWPLTPEGADQGLRHEAGLLLPQADAHELAVSREASNTACTAYAIIALAQAASGDAKDKRRIADGAEWLLRNRTPRIAEDASSGGWPVFRERGLRAGESYTYRHFSTAWALMALVEADLSVSDREVLEALDYLLSLQEPAVFDRYGAQIEGGGWKCSGDGEPYTWATANAIAALKTLRPSLEDLSGAAAVDILLRERRLEERDVAFLEPRNKAYAVNLRSAAVVAVALTLFYGLWIWAEARDEVGLSVGYILGVVGIVLVGLPWALVAGLARDREHPQIRWGVASVYGAIAFVVGVIGAVIFA